MIFTTPAPTSINGDALAAELASASCPTVDILVENVDGVPMVMVTFDGDVDQGVAAAVIAAHVPPPARPEVGNRATLEQRAEAALAANVAFLAVTTPTNTQVVAQVKLLTRECSAVIRLALGLLDSIDGS